MQTIWTKCHNEAATATAAAAAAAAEVAEGCTKLFDVVWSTVVRLLYLGPRSAWHRKCNFNEAFKWQLLYLPAAHCPCHRLCCSRWCQRFGHTHTHMEGKVLCSCCCCCCCGNVRHALGMTLKVLGKWATWKCYWPKWLKKITQNFSQWLIIKV